MEADIESYTAFENETNPYRKVSYKLPWHGRYKNIQLRKLTVVCLAIDNVHIKISNMWILYILNLSDWEFYSRNEYELSWLSRGDF